MRVRRLLLRNMTGLTIAANIHPSGTPASCMRSIIRSRPAKKNRVVAPGIVAEAADGEARFKRQSRRGSSASLVKLAEKRRSDGKIRMRHRIIAIEFDSALLPRGCLFVFSEVELAPSSALCAHK